MSVTPSYDERYNRDFAESEFERAYLTLFGWFLEALLSIEMDTSVNINARLVFGINRGLFQLVTYLSFGFLWVIGKPLNDFIRRCTRSKYYPLENAKRRSLRQQAKRLKARGKSHGHHIRVRTTLNRIPTPEEISAQWEKTRNNRAPIEKLRLGAMLADVESCVDNSLRRDAEGNIVGRNPGLRGWIEEKCPSLLPHYKTLMRYKASADKLQECCGATDPLPSLFIIEKYDTNSENTNRLDAFENSGGILEFAKEFPWGAKTFGEMEGVLREALGMGVGDGMDGGGNRERAKGRRDREWREEAWLRRCLKVYDSREKRYRRRMYRHIYASGDNYCYGSYYRCK